MTTTFPVLEGKVAIVTGAAMGMGEATAKLFAAAGARVVVADFNADKGQTVVDQIAADGGTATFVPVDISKSDQVQAMVAQTVAVCGHLDAAVNNAAIAPDDKPVAEFDEAYRDRLMSIDLRGTALCMKYELQQMITQDGGGSMVNISSASGFRPQPSHIAYVTAKHGVNGMTKVAADRSASASTPSPRGDRHADAAWRAGAVRPDRGRLRPAAQPAPAIRQA